MIISQGDQYGIPIEIKSNGVFADSSLFENVEIVIGNIRKDFSSGVVYSESEKAWIFPLTQEETLSLSTCNQKAQVRVKYQSGDVMRASLGTINIEQSLSKVVL